MRTSPVACTAHRGWILCLVLAALLVGSATAEQTAGPAPAIEPLGDPWQVEPADIELLEAVVREGDLQGGLSRPSLATYLRDLLSAAFDPFTNWMESIGGPLGAGFAWFAGGGWRVISLVLLVLILLLVAVQVWRIWRGRVRPQVTVESVVAEPPPAAVEVAEWEQRLEQRLGRGDARGALEALWWSLAIRLVGNRADPAWTSRELVDRAGRRDLLPSVRLLDRLVWGGGEPRVEEVRQLWGDLREVAG